MKMTALTLETLTRFENEYKTSQYTEEQTETIEHAAYVANMNKCAHPEWTQEDIFADFLRVLAIHHIETKNAETKQDEVTRSRDDIISDIINYFNENTDVFTSCIEELDLYNGYLGDDRYYTMDMLDEFYCNTEPTEILYRAFYGYDADTWYTDASGNKIKEAFNPNRDYFHYNGYGNLVSTDYPDYSYYMDDKDAIEAMSEYRCYVDTIEEYEELSALFDELEEV